ncbi:MAG: hypothetical protein M3Q23_01935 [Actinomycetota bacterium]|nr:hypothetical protein [Actinomycetota bacterium]
MKGPAGVLALVLAETVAGGAAFLFLTPLWREVKRGFFKLTGALLVALGVATWGAIGAARQAGDVAGRWSWWLALVFAGITLVWLVLLFARAMLAARIGGFLSLGVAVAMLVELAGTAEGSHVVSLLQLLAGSVFMGAVLDGLLLGHWYLTDRGLSRGPINRFAMALLVAVVLEAAAVIGGGFGPLASSAQFSPLLTTAGLASWLALGMVAVTALIAVMIRLTLRGTRATAVQAATGFFYLAVITAFAGELAAKVRFLP